MDDDLNAPLPLIEEEDTGNRFFVYSSNDDIRVELRVEDGTFWASQQQMAATFNVTRANITMHLQNIFKEGELDENSVCKESLHTAQDGKRYATKFYNLNAMIAVGYRVGGPIGTAFRIWATDKLFQYLTKGFVIDAKRLKAGGNRDRIAELREIIRDIRADEANVYAELRRICAMCQDYDPKSPAAHEFYGRMQAKLYRAVVNQTPSMLKKERASAEKQNMGLQGWKGDHITQADALIAKNYLFEPELRELNRLTTILLDIFEDQLEIGRLTLMQQAADLLDAQLKGFGRQVLDHGGDILAANADAQVKKVYQAFDAARRAERLTQTQKELVALAKELPKPTRNKR